MNGAYGDMKYGDTITKIAKENNQTCYRYIYALKHIFIVECWYAKVEQMPEFYNQSPVGKTVHIVDKNYESGSGFYPIMVNFNDPTEINDVVLLERNDELAVKILEDWIIERVCKLYHDIRDMKEAHITTFEEYIKWTS